MTFKSLRVGLFLWKQNDGIGGALASTLGDLGCEVITFLPGAKVPDELDVVLAYGPMGSLTPLINELLTFPSHRRPVFVLWMTEQLPNPALPAWMSRRLGEARSQAERFVYSQNRQTGGEPDGYLGWITKGAHRFRYYGDLYWLNKENYPFILAVGSQWIAGFLRERGLNTTVAYLGFHPTWQEDLELERDIPVLWLGKAATRRRKRVLESIRAELRSRDIEMLMIDGVENPYVFGEERTLLLNRTKIVLNIIRTPWDNSGLRYYLAAPNRALIVTEPTLAHTSLVPGVHLVEAKVEEIADTIHHYLTHEEERKCIVEQAYRYVSTELTMKKGVMQILEKAVVLRPTARG